MLRPQLRNNRARGGHDVTLLLSNEDVRHVWDMRQGVSDLHDALVASLEQPAVIPPRMNLAADGRFLRVMPAIVPATGLMGLKMFHGSLADGVRYLIVICSIEDGRTLAVLDAAFLTAARTGAMTGVATEQLSRRESATVGVIGSGLEAETNLAGVCAVRGIQAVKVWSPNADRRKSYASRMEDRHGVPVVPAATAEEAVRDSDIVVVATNTGTGGPVAYRGEWMHPGQHVVSIGSTTPHLREIDPETFKRADVIVFDADFDQILEESGDVAALHTMGAGWVQPTSLDEMLDPTISLRPANESVTLFKSVGTALQDLSGALTVYRRALECGAGTKVDDLADLKTF
jgi:ornithine cyclodeaminase/alanine dehydrogenase-like protein (mu-crystallin family)